MVILFYVVVMILNYFYCYIIRLSVNLIIIMFNLIDRYLYVVRVYVVFMIFSFVINVIICVIMLFI